MCLESSERESTRSLSFCLCLNCALPDVHFRADLHNEMFAEKVSECLRVHAQGNFLSIVNLRSSSFSSLPQSCHECTRESYIHTDKECIGCSGILKVQRIVDFMFHILSITSWWLLASTLYRIKNRERNVTHWIAWISIKLLVKNYKLVQFSINTIKLSGSPKEFSLSSSGSN